MDDFRDTHTVQTKGIVYKVSVRSLFILAILAETLRSIVLSPISTTNPPTISGLTCLEGVSKGGQVQQEERRKNRRPGTGVLHTLLVTLSFLPWPTYSDFATAVSKREMVLLSNCYAFPSKSAAILQIQQHNHVEAVPNTFAPNLHGGTFTRTTGTHTVALVTTISISPWDADISTPNFSQTPLRIPKRLFSASMARKFLTVSLFAAAPDCFCNSATMALLSARVSVGASRMVASLGSLSKMVLRVPSALAVGSREDVFEAAVY
jgi:hypothetical protein